LQDGEAMGERLTGGGPEPLVRVELGTCVEAKPSKLEIQTSTGEAEQAGGFRDIASRSIEGGLNHVSLDLFDGRGEAGAASKCRPFGGESRGKLGVPDFR